MNSFLNLIFIALLICIAIFSIQQTKTTKLLVEKVEFLEKNAYLRKQ